MNEAKAGLESYLEILKEMGQEASLDVLHFAEKLKKPLDSVSNNADVSKTVLTKTEDEKNH